MKLTAKVSNPFILSGSKMEVIVHRNLDLIQSGKTRRFLLSEQIPIGLGGQMTGRLEILLTGLAAGRGVIFLNDGDPPYAQSWEGMSVPSESFELTLTPEAKLKDFEVGCSQNNEILLISPLRCNFNSTELIAFQTTALREMTGIFDGNKEDFLFCVRSWLRLLPELDHEVQGKILRCEINKRTLGVHVRRGDKSVESALIPLRFIERKVNQALESGNFDSVFLATDSSTVQNKIKLPKNIRVIYDKDEKRYNNANHKMIRGDSQLANQEARTAIFNIEALSACGGVVGQDNAHFATIAACTIKGRVGSRYIFLIPGDAYERSNALIHCFFVFKRNIRAIARRLFPSMTIRYRVQRKVI